MSNNSLEALFAFIMATVFLQIAWRAAKANKDRFALWRSATNWPTTLGTIDRLGIKIVTENHTDHEFFVSDTYYTPQVCYSFAVDGNLFDGTQFDCTHRRFGSQLQTRAQISKYKPGDSKLIAYNPADPQISVLDRSIKPTSIADSTLPAYVGFFAALFLLAMGVRVLL